MSGNEIKMPALFIGHGSPMNAIEENEFSKAWTDMAQNMPLPRAILCISAHWETTETFVTAMEQPRTIHDFYGFPKSLYDIHYAAAGSPSLARRIAKGIATPRIGLDYDWGLDHGTWSVLGKMYPDASIPVLQLSLDRSKDPAFHYDIGKKLAAMRKEGVLIIGSGNMVHNLGRLVWQDMAFDWALEFDEMLKKYILSGDHNKIVNYDKLGKTAHLSIPTNEHFLPLLYILALQEKQDEVQFYSEKVTLGSISMRCLRLG